MSLLSCFKQKHCVEKTLYFEKKKKQVYAVQY